MNSGDDNGGHCHEETPYKAGILQGSPMSLIVGAIFNSRLITSVKEYISAERVLFVDNLSWVATPSNVNWGDSILERCAANSLQWACCRGLRFNCAKMQVPLFTCRRGYKKQLWSKLIAMIKVRVGFIPLNNQPTHWLGIWMDAHLMFKERHNQRMKKARAADARFRTVTPTLRVFPETVLAVLVVCVQAVALYGSDLWWDTEDVGRWDNLQLLRNLAEMKGTWWELHHLASSPGRAVDSRSRHTLLGVNTWWIPTNNWSSIGRPDCCCVCCPPPDGAPESDSPGLHLHLQS